MGAMEPTVQLFDVVTDPELQARIKNAAREAAVALSGFWRALGEAEKQYPGYQFGDKDPDVVALLAGDAGPELELESNAQIVHDYLNVMSVEFFEEKEA
jgi:hypothetical protein